MEKAAQDIISSLWQGTSTDASPKDINNALTPSQRKWRKWIHCTQSAFWNAAVPKLTLEVNTLLQKWLQGTHGRPMGSLWTPSTYTLKNTSRRILRTVPATQTRSDSRAPWDKIYCRANMTHTLSNIWYEWIWKVYQRDPDRELADHFQFHSKVQTFNGWWLDIKSRQEEDDTELQIQKHIFYRTRWWPMWSISTLPGGRVP